MADVFLVERRGPSSFLKRFAIKITKPVGAGEEEESRRRFEAEARLGGILEHPNIVRVYDFAQYPRPYLVMEYVDGASLLELLRRLLRAQERMPFALAAHVCSRVGRALEHAHVQCSPGGEPLGLIHRDVSSANVLLSYEGEVKLTDFGIALAVDSPWKTMTGTVLGKTGYMSPEQALGEPMDARSDIFSAGVVLWELLTMRPLYPQNDADAQRRRGLRQRPPLAHQIDPSVPRELSEVASRALEPLPEDRTMTAGQLADELDEVLSHYRSSPLERSLSALLNRHFPRKPLSDDEEATLVEAALPGDVRIEPETSPRRTDETPTVADGQTAYDDHELEADDAFGARPPEEPEVELTEQGGGSLSPFGDFKGSPLEPPRTPPRFAPPSPAEESPRRATNGRNSRPVAQIPPIAAESDASTLIGMGGASSAPETPVEERPGTRSTRRIGPEEPTVTAQPALGLGARRKAALWAFSALGVGATVFLIVLQPWATSSREHQVPEWHLRSRPVGFGVFVDDRLVGVTPFDLPWSQIPAGAAITALKDGFPPFVALGRSLSTYRLGLAEFPGSISPYPPGARIEAATVALRKLDNRIVGYTTLSFRAGSPEPREERIHAAGRQLLYRYDGCRPSVPCIVEAQ